MTVTRSGSTRKYAENWSKAFGGGNSKSAKASTSKTAKAAKTGKKKAKAAKKKSAGKRK